MAGTELSARKGEHPLPRVGLLALCLACSSFNADRAPASVTESTRRFSAPRELPANAKILLSALTQYEMAQDDQLRVLTQLREWVGHDEVRSRLISLLGSGELLRHHRGELARQLLYLLGTGPRGSDAPVLEAFTGLYAEAGRLAPWENLTAILSKGAQSLATAPLPTSVSSNCFSLVASRRSLATELSVLQVDVVRWLLEHSEEEPALFSRFLGNLSSRERSQALGQILEQVFQEPLIPRNPESVRVFAELLCESWEQGVLKGGFELTRLAAVIPAIENRLQPGGVPPALKARFKRIENEAKSLLQQTAKK